MNTITVNFLKFQTLFFHTIFCIILAFYALFLKIFSVMSNKEDPDLLWEQSDLGLHCLHMPLCQTLLRALLRSTYSICFCREIGTRGYKTFFMLNSAEHEICPANKSQITDNCKFFGAKHS